MAERAPQEAPADDAAVGRWLRHVQLAFLGFYFVRFLFPPIQWWEYIVNGLGLAVFLLFYFQAGRTYFNEGPVHRRDVLWPIAGMTATGALMTPFNPGANVFFIFAAYFVGRTQPRRTAWTGIGTLLLVIMLLGLFVNPNWNFWLPAVVVILGVGGLAMRDRRDAQMRAQLADSREEARRLARAAERERIGRDLHDVLGHTLSLITLKSELAGKLIERDPQAAAQEVREIEQVSRKAMAEMRDTMQGYQEIDLDAEVDALEAALGTSGVTLERHMESLPQDPRLRTAVALLLREAVTNVIRHARASVCRIRLEETADDVVVTISDDGRGSDGREGYGIRGMRARVADLGGSLSVTNGAGTQVVARLPSGH